MALLLMGRMVSCLYVFIFVTPVKAANCILYYYFSLNDIGPVITRWSCRHSVGWEVVVSGSFPES